MELGMFIHGKNSEKQHSLLKLDAEILIDFNSPYEMTFSIHTNYV